MKFINLDGLTTAERLVVLENICNDIIAHLNKETLYTTVDEYSASTLNYDITKLNPKTEVMPESGQLVYFSNGYVGIIGNIDTIGNTYGVNEVTNIKGDKGITALESRYLWKDTSNPTLSSVASIPFSYFNRTPVVGDSFIVQYQNTSSNASYLVTAVVDSIQDNTATCSPIQWLNTKGDKGEKGDTGSSGIQEVTVTGYNGRLTTEEITKLNDHTTVIVRDNDRYYFNGINKSGQAQYISYKYNANETPILNIINVMVSDKSWSYTIKYLMDNNSLFQTIFALSGSGINVLINIISTNGKLDTFTDLLIYLQDNRCVSAADMYPASGYYTIDGSTRITVLGVYAADSFQIGLVFEDGNVSLQSEPNAVSSKKIQIF